MSPSAINDAHLALIINREQPDGNSRAPLRTFPFLSPWGLHPLGLFLSLFRLLSLSSSVLLARIPRALRRARRARDKLIPSVFLPPNYRSRRYRTLARVISIPGRKRMAESGWRERHSSRANLLFVVLPRRETTRRDISLSQNGKGEKRVELNRRTFLV